MGSQTTAFLNFNKRGAWNKHGGAKFGPFLINEVSEIRELLYIFIYILYIYLLYV